METMKNSKLQRLALAVMAAGILFGGASRVMSTEISATDFVTNLHQYVENGEIAAAMDALRQLQALGINQIRIGDQFYAIADVLAALDNPSQARMMLATLMASVNAGVTVYFVAENRTVASVEWAPTNDVFPTGSAG